MTINIDAIMSAGNGLKVLFKRDVASGISDIKDIVIIIPDVKDKILAIRLSWFFVLKKQGIIPSVVDSPARVVIKSDCFIFILNSMYNLFIN